jgi:CDGSH-type Zn-finger protein
MPFIAANGLVILLPSAFYLASKAAAGEFDGWFYAAQGLELIAGAANLTMMGLNIRDGLTMTGRIGGNPSPEDASSSRPAIEERDGGPIVAKGVSRLAGPDGESIDAKPVMALCRCGASKNKPFCDGSHNEVGFDSRPSEDHEPDRVRVYEGAHISVHYNRLLCSHAGECARRLKSVFDPSRKPWVVTDNGSADEIMAVVEACPSGALRYSLTGQAPRHAVADGPCIAVEKAGPYRVTGIPLATARLAEGASSDKYVLCRCGASKNKPYCDGTHHDIAWQG